MAAPSYNDLALCVEQEDWSLPKYHVRIVEHLLGADAETLYANGYACTVLATTARDAITAWQRLYPDTLTPELWDTLEFSDGTHAERADSDSWDRINVRAGTTLTVAFARPHLPLTIDLWSEDGVLLSTTEFDFDPHHLSDMAVRCCNEIKDPPRFIVVDRMTFELPSGRRFAPGTKESYVVGSFIRATSGLTTRMRLNVVGPIEYA